MPKKTIKDFKPSKPCSCNECKQCCKRPCWPTPKDAKRLLDAGYADRLMLDYWADDPDIYLLCGANPGHEGSDAPGLFGLTSGCVFQDDNGFCELHEIDLKPFEGRVAHHDQKNRDVVGNLHELIAMSWKSAKGKAIIKRWKKLVDGNI